MRNVRWSAILTASVLLVLSVAPTHADSFEVTNTNDSGGGSLRQALTDAKDNSGPDVVVFDIPTSDSGYNPSTGVWTIQPLSPTLTLYSETVLDATTQTDNQGDTNPFGPEIELDGTNAGATAVGIDIAGSESQIWGLAINRFSQAGLEITCNMSNTVGECYIGTDPTGTISQANGIGVHLNASAEGNSIGGGTPGLGNLISGNATTGMTIDYSNHNKVLGNIIGADRTGTARLPNGTHGVLLTNDAQYNDIGGELPEHGNLISGNNWFGIKIEGSDTMINRVGGNTIGLNMAQTEPLGNGHHGIGIYGGAVLNEVGSSFLQPNVIGCNAWAGVAIVDSNTNRVFDNYIGTTPAGAQWLGNGYNGVHIVDGNHNTVSSNTIAYNGLLTSRAGVQVEGTTAVSNPITVNSIHHNGGKGIALVGGGNKGLAAPIITAANCQAVTGTACANCTVEVFSDWEDEGQRVHSPPYAFADGSGNWSWNGDLTGPNVTATNQDSALNTSEFSAPWYVGCYNIQNLPVILRNH